MPDYSCEEDEKFPKPLIFFHGVSLDLIELYFEELVEMFDVYEVEGWI